MRYVIAYDVADDSRRARLAAICAAYGDRIQLSVFECTLDEREVAELLRRANTIVDVDDDSVHLFPVCMNCNEGRALIGQADRPPDDPFWVV